MKGSVPADKGPETKVQTSSQAATQWSHIEPGNSPRHRHPRPSTTSSKAGLPKGHLYLVEGDPGTGKTTLALQFLLEGQKIGEKGMYITLSESKLELEQVAASHGWDVDPISIYEMIPSEEDLSTDAQYTVFHPSDVELADTMTANPPPGRNRRPAAHRLRLALRVPHDRPRPPSATAVRSSPSSVTSPAATAPFLLLDDRTAEGNVNDLQLQSIAHGVIKMQSLERELRHQSAAASKCTSSAARTSAKASTTTPSKTGGHRHLPAPHRLRAQARLRPRPP